MSASRSNVAYCWGIVRKIGFETLVARTRVSESSLFRFYVR